MRKDLATLAAIGASALALGTGCQSTRATDSAMFKVPGMTSSAFYSERDSGKYQTTRVVYCDAQGNKEAYVTSLDLTNKTVVDSQGKPLTNSLPIALIPADGATRDFDMDGRTMSLYGNQYLLTKVGSRGVNFVDKDGSFVRVNEQRTATNDGRTATTNGTVDVNLPIRYLDGKRFFELTAGQGTRQDGLQVLYVPVSNDPRVNQIHTTISPAGNVVVTVDGEVYQPVQATLKDKPKPRPVVPKAPQPAAIPTGNLN